WQSSDDGYYDFKIIHQGRCDRKRYPASSALQDFLGPQGASYCLTFLSYGPVIARDSNYSRCKVTDLDEFVDFMRRVQVPYYEEARRLFGHPDVRSDLADANEFYPYIPDTMKSLIERYAEGFYPVSTDG